jgi:hypothetical protein
LFLQPRRSAYCAVRALSIYITITLILVFKRPCHGSGWLVARLSPRRPGFAPGSVNVRLVAEVSFFSEYFGFPLSVSFHHCSVLASIYMLLLLEAQRTKSGNLPKGSFHSEIGTRGCADCVNMAQDRGKWRDVYTAMNMRAP